jgi:hypothetical protein
MLVLLCESNILTGVTFARHGGHSVIYEGRQYQLVAITRNGRLAVVRLS